MPPSSGFPPGWTFVIDPNMHGWSSSQAKKSQKLVAVDGLKIFSPGRGREYYSPERAKAHYTTALEEASSKEFYRHIGAMPSLVKAASKKSTKQGNRACGACDNCTKEACGRCIQCRSSPSGVSQSCFQKVRLNVCVMLAFMCVCPKSPRVWCSCEQLCLVAKPRVIAKPAVGFPEGYHFFFRQGSSDCAPRLMILTPGGREYSLQGALQHCRLDNRDKISSEFCRHVGITSPGDSQWNRDHGTKQLSKEKQLPASLKSRESPLTLQELLQYGCGECVNCEKDACGQCASCSTNRGSFNQVCIQKVCRNSV